MGWKNWPTWAKGGVIGGTIGLLVFIWSLTSTPPNKSDFLFSIIFFLLFWIILIVIGMVIGKIVMSSKIKNRSAWKTGARIGGTITGLLSLHFVIYAVAFCPFSGSRDWCSFGLLPLISGLLITGPLDELFNAVNLPQMGFFGGMLFIISGLLINSLVGAIVGAIIGLIIGKIKSKKAQGVEIQK